MERMGVEYQASKICLLSPLEDWFGSRQSPQGWNQTDTQEKNPLSSKGRRGGASFPLLLKWVIWVHSKDCWREREKNKWLKCSRYEMYACQVSCWQSEEGPPCWGWELVPHVTWHLLGALPIISSPCPKHWLLGAPQDFPVHSSSIHGPLCSFCSIFDLNNLFGPESSFLAGLHHDLRLNPRLSLYLKRHFSEKQ